MYQLAFAFLQMTANLGGLTHESLVGSWAGLPLGSSCVGGLTHVLS